MKDAVFEGLLEAVLLVVPVRVPVLLGVEDPVFVWLLVIVSVPVCEGVPKAEGEVVDKAEEVCVDE